ncbi:MAG TPA: monothiol bacilliredoxin BrxC family protein [Gemmatimonadales bacterium]|jgi:bacillithiol system protein YtxJ|nr:monothiol bacilliredoxin BrxC family protein [Gemmatimonadales bacterium]
MPSIGNEAELAAALAAPIAVLYKHSPICPTSSMAYEEIRALRRQRDVPVYLIDVVGNRPLSRRIAEQVGVRHASPQVIILLAGVAAWSATHFEVEAETMLRALDRLTAGEPAPD